jgi:hypothetical protein
LIFHFKVRVLNRGYAIVAYYTKRGAAGFEWCDWHNAFLSRHIEWFNFNVVFTVDGGDIPKADGRDLVLPILERKHFY